MKIIITIFITAILCAIVDELLGIHLGTSAPVVAHKVAYTLSGAAMMWAILESNDEKKHS